MGGVQERALEDEGLLGVGVTLLKQQTTQKEAIPAPDRPASCVPKCFFLISVQRQQERDSKHSEEGRREGGQDCWLTTKRHIPSPWSPQIIQANTEQWTCSVKAGLKGRDALLLSTVPTCLTMAMCVDDRVAFMCTSVNMIVPGLISPQEVFRPVRCPYVCVRHGAGVLSLGSILYSIGNIL